MGLTGRQALNYSMLAGNFFNILQYDSALNYFHLANHLFDSLNDPTRKATNLSNISDIYSAMGLFDKALVIMKEALNVHNIQGNIREVARIQNSIGNIFMDSQKYDSAKYYFRQAIPNAKSVGYDYMVLIARFNVGKALSLEGDYNNASPVLEEIYDFCNKNGIAAGQMHCLLRMGLNKSEEDMFEEAANLLQEGLRIANEEKDLTQEREFLAALIQMEHKLSKSDSLESYYKQLDIIEDSINIQQMRIKVAETEALYESQKKEAKIKALSQQNHYYVLRNRYLIAIFTLLLLATIFALFYYRKRNQLLAQKHLLSVKENKLKQLSLEKSNLQNRLKDEMINNQNLKIRQKSQELVFATLKQSRHIEVNNQLQEELLPLLSRQKTKTNQKILSGILNRLNTENNYEPLQEFENLFCELHPDFYATISETFPDITPRELQICAMISLNLQTKDVSNITNISVSSLETIRYRIRTKMRLTPDQTITVELMKLC